MGSCCAKRQPELPKCRAAEQRLLKHLPEVQVHDTGIRCNPKDGAPVYIHSLEIWENRADDRPLVCLPGYGTGAAIFANVWRRLRQVEGTHRRLIAVDPLGMFLSSRPRWTPGVDVELAESWMVESLESWCVEKQIEQMDLLGHSIGGNIAAAFAERYPHRVRTLVLLSPAGLCAEPADYRSKLPSAPWRVRLALRLWGRGYSPLTAVRWIPRRYGYRISHWNAKRWTRSSEEQDFDVEALGDYIYHGWTEGPESAGAVIGALLHPGAWGKKPLVSRLPLLKVKRIEMIYGNRDWMDFRHGNKVADACAAADAPEAWVQLIEAGHYAHLENATDFCGALLRALGPRSDEMNRSAPVPEGYAERFLPAEGKRLPNWRAWEGYDFGR